MKKIFILIATLGVVGCNSSEFSLHSAIKHAREANFDKAITEYESLLNNNPENALYQNNLGWVLFRNGQFAEAREHIQRASEIDLDNRFAETIRINLEMIEAYDSSRESICVDLESGNDVAQFKDKDNFEIQFQYAAIEIGYLLTAECYQNHGDTKNSELAYEKLVDLYKGKGFESTLVSKASAILKNG